MHLVLRVNAGGFWEMVDHHFDPLFLFPAQMIPLSIQTFSRRHMCFLLCSILNIGWTRKRMV